MRQIYSALGQILCGLLLMVAVCSGGLARAAAPETPEPPPVQSETPSASMGLDRLFEQLHAAQSAPEAARIARLIQQNWLRSDSPAADLLMERAGASIRGGDYPLAVELLDRILVLQPDWAEAWNRRATVFFLMDDFSRSIADIRETLRREPRHFGALTGLGTILVATGDTTHAYEAFKRALAIYPRLEAAENAVRDLKSEVEGSDL